jgi:hypothetical protein
MALLAKKSGIFNTWLIPIKRSRVFTRHAIFASSRMRISKKDDRSVRSWLYRLLRSSLVDYARAELRQRDIAERLASKTAQVMPEWLAGCPILILFI